ncbi:MAG: hypothetical protein HZA24_05645 [Nitrospirae bacterium]|nr:hypothetical protein [Nitrospirota bacterium]
MPLSDRPAPGTARKRARYFLTWWSVIILMLLALAVTFGFGAVLLGYVVWIGLDPEQSFGSLWHPLVAVPLGLFAAAGSAWLFLYGVTILRGVVQASNDLARRRALGGGGAPGA